MNVAHAEILLSTYNGAPFLQELLCSLDAQTDQGWTLLVRDDGSADGTVSILNNWGKECPDKIRWLHDGLGRLGAVGSFAALLAASEADYFLLCDQDDFWVPEKIARLKKKIRAAEREFECSTPILVHTDMIVVDRDLRSIAKSFWAYERLALPSLEAPWKILALQNVVTGCAMIGNASLRDAAVPLPPEAVVHDWWLALTAACLGKIIRDPEPSVLYRQHGENSLGAVSWAARSAFAWLLTEPLGLVNQARVSIRRSRSQAHLFAQRYEQRLNPDVHSFLLEYGELGGRNVFRRKTFPIRHGAWFGDAIRNLGLLALI
jgi:glycosyltransferase involved in cell wall biosynthesis